jgi:hypothetical protein
MFLFLILSQAHTLDLHTNSLFQNELVCESSFGSLIIQDDYTAFHDVIIFDCDVFDENHSQICWELFNTSPV